MKDILVELESRANTGYLRDAITEIKQLRRRRDDLLAANSLEVEKRRAAENKLSATRITIGAVLKELKAHSNKPFGAIEYAEHLFCVMSASRTEHSSWTEAEREFEQYVSRNPKVAEQPANT